MNRTLRPLLLALAPALVACEDSTGSEPLVPVDAAAVRFVVRHSDYTSSAYSLLAADGTIVADGYVHSGSRSAGLSAALSGDTDLPTTLASGELTILDRFGTDVLTRIDLATGTVLGQLRTQGESTTGFSSNPQDYLAVSATSAWVSRYGDNADPSAAADVRGSDLLELDPTTMTRTGRVISLSAFATTLGAAPNEVAVPPGPRRMVRVGGFAAVGLDRLAADFSGAAPGLVAIVDLDVGTATSHDLSPMTNCGSVLPVPGSPSAVAVVCAGFTDKLVESGVAILTIDSNGDVTEVDRYESGADAAPNAIFDSVVMLDQDELLGVSIGGFTADAPPDVLVHLDLSTDTRTTILTAGYGSALFSTMAFDPTTATVLVPEGGVGIRRYQRGTGAAFTALSTVTVSGRGLPVVGVSLVGTP